jgi:BioD-like phosphotransacetylase family protein
MVKPIFLSSLTERVGKTLLSIGILKKLLKEGKKVAYFKPVGIPKGTGFASKSDPDVGFIQKMVIKEYHAPEDICPITIAPNYYIDNIDSDRKEDYWAKIKDAYEKVSEGMDYVLIEGNPTIVNFARVGLDDVTIAQQLGIKELVLMISDSTDFSIDNLFFTDKYFQFRNFKIKGIIFNVVDYEYIARIRELEKNHINRYGLDVIGVIEKSIELLSARVSEVQAAIGGELINEAASSGLENPVETYIIGAMNTQAALKYLRQVKRAAIITGGDRTDMAMAALDQDISCLILTGFIQPDLSVITSANEKNIPILLSPSDTYTTIRNMEKLKPGLQEDDIENISELIEKQINWDLLLK